MRKSILLVTIVLGLSCLCACASKDSAPQDAGSVAAMEDGATDGATEDSAANDDTANDDKDSDDWVRLDEASDADKSADAGEDEKSQEEVYIEVDESVLSYEAFGDYEEVPVWTASATSMLEDREDYYRYHPDNLFDHDLSTAYVEGKADDGVGQMVEFLFGTSFESTTYAVTKIEIRPGYQKSKDSFENNSRPTKLSFYFPNGTSQTIDMGKDYDENAVFTIDMEPTVTNKCTMVIDGAVTGKRFDDLCISEVTFYCQKTNGIMYMEEVPGKKEGDSGISADYIINGRVDDRTAWSYKTHNPLTELTQSSYLASGFGQVIVYNEQEVVALDALTGEELWRRDDCGFPGAVSFDKDGNLYICDYFGSNITVIDKDGNTVKQVERLAGEDYSWASMLVVKDNAEICIYYAQSDSDNSYGEIYSTTL